jgi:hypothetical protein
LKASASRRCSGVVVLLGVLVVLNPAFAQQRQSPALDDILLALEDNVHHYDAAVPSFFGDEHVVSKMVPDPRHQDATTDSTFRLKRVVNADGRPTLVESRDVKVVYGDHASGKDLVGPSIVRGAFSGGLSIVSLSQKACMRYTLEPINPGSPGEPYVIQFASRPKSERPTDCHLIEDGSGRVYVDPATMQIQRMELTVPHHTISANSYKMPVTMGVWDLSIDYSPVLLGGQSFWLPVTIASSTKSTSGDPSRTAWSFVATYSNYHKLEVSSRIVPVDEGRER